MSFRNVIPLQKFLDIWFLQNSVFPCFTLQHTTQIRKLIQEVPNQLDYKVMINGYELLPSIMKRQILQINVE